MHDPYTLIGNWGPLTLWHRDAGGADGACGWFMRAHHGDPKVLKRIEVRFREDWFRAFKVHTGYYSEMGFFSSEYPHYPVMSIHAIALNLFFLAAYEHFSQNRSRANRFMRRHLYEILMFAENPNDSPYQRWTKKYGVDERTSVKDQIESAAAMIYGWILRESRPWYQHPRWHIHHWRLRVR